MLTDVQAYFDATNAAQETYTNAADTRNAALTAAWDALRDSGNRMVAFIAERAGDHGYREYAEAVLRVLPATEAQILQVARDNHFDSGVFEDLLRQAREAGAVEPVAVIADGRSDARADLESWARNIAPGYVTDTHIGALMGHVDRVVAAER